MREQATAVLRSGILVALLPWLGIATASGGDRTDPLPFETTRVWLQMQRAERGRPPRRPLPSQAALRIYAEYLRAFEHPLPEFFPRGESGSTGGR